MGLPAIVSSHCGAAEVISHGVDGWVCRPDDAGGLASLLTKADQSVRGGASMGEAARAAAERFPMEAMAQKLAELYASL
jgi:glycosyltransferase involved in cell wall biosynthesis